MPNENSPRETPPAMPLNDRANCRIGPSFSTTKTNAKDNAPHARQIHRAICSHTNNNIITEGCYNIDNIKN